MQKTVAEILAEVDQFVTAKQASFQGGFKRAQAMNGIADMPGSEHDSKVPSEYEKPDPEVDDGSQGPEGAFSNIEGAGKEDITQKHVLEVDQPAETPDKEPLVTDEADADPKTASVKLANNLLARIKELRTSSTKRADNQKLEIKLDAKTLDKLAKDQQPAAKKEEKKAEPAKEEKKAEAAKPDAKEIAKQLVSKVAAEKKASAKAEELKGAEAAFNDFLKAAYEKGARDTLEKLAQLAGADPAVAAALPAEQQGIDPAAAQDAAAAMAATPGADAQIEVPEELKGDEVSAEDVVEALGAAVESGEIDADTAQAVLSELAAAEAGEADTEPPAEAKEAAQKFASAIAEAHAEIAKKEAAQAAKANKGREFFQAIKEASDEIAAAEAAQEEPTVEEIQEAVAELVEEGQIAPEAGAAILEQVGAAEAPAGDVDKEASVKQAAEFVKALAKGYRDSGKKDEAEFAKAIKEASDEIDAAETGAANQDDKGEAPADNAEVDPETVLQGIVELVQAGEVSPEDAEDAIHAILGGAEE